MIEVTDGAAQKDEQGRQVFIDGAEAFFVARMAIYEYRILAAAASSNRFTARHGSRLAIAYQLSVKAHAALVIFDRYALVDTVISLGIFGTEGDR